MRDNVLCEVSLIRAARTLNAVGLLAIALPYHHSKQKLYIPSSVGINVQYKIHTSKKCIVSKTNKR